MAGDWLKIEVCTPDKPEVIGIADLIGIAPSHAFGSLFLVWRWFDQHTTEGNASYVTKVTIDRLSGNAGFADAMVKVGWLTIKDDGTVALPHFDNHNGETAKQRGLTAKRVAKSKAKSNGTGNAPTVTNGVTSPLPREEKRREDIDININNKPSRKKSKSQIPDDFKITDQVRSWAEKNGHSRLAERCEHFINTAKAKGYEYADWDAAFRNAISDDWARLGKASPVEEFSMDSFLKRVSS